MTDGEHIEYYHSGGILSRINYLCGINNGECIYYYETGEISSIINYKDGRKNGESINYFKSGLILFMKYYINNIKVSEFEWVSYNRNLKLELLGL